MASVYECATCKQWMCGAAYFRKDAPKDRYGRIDRDYDGPTFCSEKCRDSEPSE